MKQTFYSNGKLLITGEYLVLDGAKALALPTKFGQSLEIIATNKKSISWKSYDFDETCWFETEFSFDEIIYKTVQDSNSKVKNTLLEILSAAFQLNDNVLNSELGFEVTTRLSFPRNWGLGTSSTLINNISQWFEVDAFVLLQNSFGGSGYDIACAQNNGPILYEIQDKIPNVTLIDFHPIFSKNIYFVYLNQKQNSQIAIENYRKNTDDKESIITAIAFLTKRISTTSDFIEFEKALFLHEMLVGARLNQTPIQQQLFSDFDGTVKSLGAWGGDFVLVVSKTNPKEYFKAKGFEIILTFEEMIL